jgi:hypothetical protein
MTDARVSREQVEVLEALTVDARVSREQVEVLERLTVDARVSREQIEVLWSTVPAPIGYWWDGSTKQIARLKGWWDGSQIQPVKPPYPYAG